MGMFSSDPRPAVTFPDVGRTKQSMKDECDINNILARYKNSGHLTHVSMHTGRYADVSEITDFRTAVDHVRAGEKFFQGLSAKVRARFDNDAAAFLDFIGDPRNLEEMRELGLAPLVEKEPAPEVEPAPSAPEEP